MYIYVHIHGYLDKHIHTHPPNKATTHARTHLAVGLLALGRDGVDLVDEDDGGRVLLRLLERLVVLVEEAVAKRWAGGVRESVCACVCLEGNGGGG
jgi:hypothetical protein